MNRGRTNTACFNTPISARQREANSWEAYFALAVCTVVSLPSLWGCAAAPRVEAPQPAVVEEKKAPADTSLHGRETFARDLAERQEYAEALVQWKILAVIDPSNKGYTEQVSLLQATIARQTERHRREGMAFWRAGAYDSARVSFLRWLALDPRDRVALHYLREIDRLQTQSWSVNNASGDSLKGNTSQKGANVKKQSAPETNSHTRPVAPDTAY